MRLLLDTPVFLWYITADPRLPGHLVPLLRDPANDVYTSAVSAWEVTVKHQLGKLPLPQPPETYLPQERQAHAILPLPLEETGVARLAALPLLHRDPFDRMLLCQCLHRGLTLVTVDAALQSNPPYVPLIP